MTHAAVEQVDRKRMALQIGAGLCAGAAVLHLIGGNLLFPIFYAVSAIGLFGRAQRSNRWAVPTALTCASLFGALNLLGVVVSISGQNVIWLIVNVLIIVAVSWGSREEPKPGQERKSIGIF